MEGDVEMGGGVSGAKHPTSSSVSCFHVVTALTVVDVDL